MILSVGIDCVEIERFSNWHLLPSNKLRRIFSEYEIEYCLSNECKRNERFAARFAAREALYKAISSAGLSVPFLSLCSAVSICGVPPVLIVNDSMSSALFQEQKIKIHLSMSHTKSIATAVIIIELLK